MKKRNFEAKLKLNKEPISNLNAVKGGGDPSLGAVSCDTKCYVCEDPSLGAVSCDTKCFVCEDPSLAQVSCDTLCKTCK